MPSTSPTRLRSVTHWSVWALPSRVLTSVLLVELTAVSLFVLDLRLVPVERADLVAVAVLCGLGVLHTECAVGIERVRQRVGESSLHVDLSSVWTFAAAVLLPPAWATVVVLVVFNHLWWRAWRHLVKPHKQVFNLATIVLACYAAAAVVAYFGGYQQILALAMAILVYLTVNSALVAGAIALSKPTPRPRAGEVLGRWDDNLLELSTLCLGALTAVALMSNPWYVVLMLPAVLVVHRAALVRQLEELAATDSKTGLLNAAAWHVRARRELRRAQRVHGSAAVLILDLDHFKSVNDLHGHLAGDEVLTAVAAALLDEVREHDLVGRFGGEEFVVLLPGLDDEHPGPAELHTIAERIRHRIATLTVVVDTPDGVLTINGLSTSVGGAMYPINGATLEQVMGAADTALYAAKHHGRNAVRIASAVAADSRASAPAPAPRATTG